MNDLTYYPEPLPPKDMHCCFNCLRDIYIGSTNKRVHIHHHCEKEVPGFQETKVYYPNDCPHFLGRSVAYVLMPGSSVCIDGRIYHYRNIPSQ